MTLNSELWIDSPDLFGCTSIDSFVEACATHCEAYGVNPSTLWDFFINGYAIIDNAVPLELIDAYLARIGQIREQSPSDVLASCGRDPMPLSELDPAKPLTKILDTHWIAQEANPLVFSDKIRNFIACLLDEELLAFQSLHFEVGSTQAVHQDPAYVVIAGRPNHFAASWIALEDIGIGSGELVYYPKSHRFDNFLYGLQKNRKHWDPAIDGNEIHDHHLFWLHEEAQRKGLTLSRFAPRKGDALIWHSDLAHGGGEITQKNVTRRSLVTHYTRISDTPYYFRDTIGWRSSRVMTFPGWGHKCSMYYQ